MFAVDVNGICHNVVNFSDHKRNIEYPSRHGIGHGDPGIGFAYHLFEYRVSLERRNSSFQRKSDPAGFDRFAPFPEVEFIIQIIIGIKIVPEIQDVFRPDIPCGNDDRGIERIFACKNMYSAFKVDHKCFAIQIITGKVTVIADRMDAIRSDIEDFHAFAFGTHNLQRLFASICRFAADIVYCILYRERPVEFDPFAVNPFFQTSTLQVLARIELPIEGRVFGFLFSYYETNGVFVKRRTSVHRIESNVVIGHREGDLSSVIIVLEILQFDRTDDSPSVKRESVPRFFRQIRNRIAHTNIYHVVLVVETGHKSRRIGFFDRIIILAEIVSHIVR